MYESYDSWIPSTSRIFFNISNKTDIPIVFKITLSFAALSHKIVLTEQKYFSNIEYNSSSFEPKYKYLSTGFPLLVSTLRVLSLHILVFFIANISRSFWGLLDIKLIMPSTIAAVESSHLSLFTKSSNSENNGANLIFWYNGDPLVKLNFRVKYTANFSGDQVFWGSFSTSNPNSSSAKLLSTRFWLPLIVANKYAW